KWRWWDPLRGHLSWGQAHVQLYGNGFLDVQQHVNVGITIGSLEGDGQVFLGGATLSIGSNNLSTTFSGVIQGNSSGFIGALTKVGTASLTLTGANSYFGTTTIEGGKLVVNNTTGSGTGSGQVQVNGGTLGGIGTIAGAVVIGTGSGAKAILAPGQSKGQPDTLTIQSPLTFNSDGIYQCEVNSKRAVADKIVANGVTINGARLTLRDTRGFVLPQGTVIIIIGNTSANPISGNFSNLADGGTVTAGANTYRANYEGGDGNDFTLTVLP
ncbi:MAG TPA: autotransporter-associated beta strand repeat-containing protein, partial [Candidatus Binataceae bacterium]|nr:autotransporter-associated beta strand repeat-containing protein [Candidatus Binataceae bacterium]